MELKKSALVLQNPIQLSRRRYFGVSLVWQAEQLLKLSTSNEVKLGWHVHTPSSYCLIIIRQSINSVSIRRTCMKSYCLPVPQVFLNMTVIVWDVSQHSLGLDRQSTMNISEMARHIKIALLHCGTAGKSFRFIIRPSQYITSQIHQSKIPSRKSTSERSLVFNKHYLKHYPWREI